MIRARFRMTLPPDTWISSVSRSHPDATFRLLTGVPVEDRAMELGEIVGGDCESAAEAIRTHPAVVAYDSLYADEERTLAQYESTDQGLYEFLGRSSLPPEFPVVVTDGRFEFDLTATREQFEAVGTALDESAFDYDLLSVVETGDETDSRTDREGGLTGHGGLLTDRQRECLDAALREGYFEVPRECTLADLAETLEIDKSTASEILRRGERRVLGAVLLGND
ncbi:helix-turn-helix domain-containing protein [Halorussus limi]|uniref:Helix-turn-helix domain-containing protein n=1 Tax=Halorussus limi TaxID=2938695 RepID=A0A8U0HVB4_9EURY|nr:helix-turn-helix domain-containing protein [Halorussus limi]UPV75022.1 helix-turn-helix domain-containing protein [Halorussus limi]